MAGNGASRSVVAHERTDLPQTYRGRAGKDPRAMDPELELAVNIARWDPSERDKLAATRQKALRRLKAAAAELLRASGALVLALYMQLAMASARGRVTESRGDIEGVELSVLALEDLMRRFFYRKVTKPARVLGALGGRATEGARGGRAISLHLAERSYRRGQRYGGAGFAAAADAPLVKVMLGVKVEEDGVPLWCIRRFVRNDEGSYKELAAGVCHAEPPARTADAPSALISFFSDPDPFEQTPQTAEQDPTHNPSHASPS